MKKVLVVDDSTFMRKMMMNLLIKNGYEVIGEASNGKIGLHKYIELKPDVVTMDVTMDVMDGLEALSRILGHDPNANVIMVSSMGQEIIVRDAIMLGAKNFIVKPFDDKQVLDALNKL